MSNLSKFVENVNILYADYGDTKYTLHDTALFFAERG